MVSGRGRAMVLRALGAVGRLPLVALCVAMVAGLGEVFDVWGGPDGYFVPSAGNMPHWGLYVLVVLFPLSALLLVLGWWRRWPRAIARVLAPVLWLAGTLQAVWVALLLWSFVAEQIELSQQTMGAGEGQFLELVLALAAGLTAWVHVRDARVIRRVSVGQLASTGE